MTDEHTTTDSERAATDRPTTTTDHETGSTDQSRRDVLRVTGTAAVAGLASTGTVSAMDGDATPDTAGGLMDADVHVSNDATEEKPIKVLIRDEGGRGVVYQETFSLPGLNADESNTVDDATTTANVDATGDGRYTVEAFVPGEDSATADVVMTQFGMARDQRVVVSVTPGDQVSVASYFG